MAISAMGSLGTLISELTEARKIEWAHADEELLNFENILEDVLLILSDNIKAVHAHFTVDVTISEFTFSRRKLRSIVFNLHNNAIKFRSTERQLKIDISTCQENNFVVISVRDNGIGIAEDQLDKIFSKYHRLDDTVEGSGIGLYLVKEVLTNAGGKITVKSRLGEGSEFKV